MWQDLARVSLRCHRGELFELIRTGTVGILLVTSIVSLLGLYGRPQLIERSLFRPYELSGTAAITLW